MHDFHEKEKTPVDSKHEHRMKMPTLACLILITLKFLHADGDPVNNADAAGITVSPPINFLRKTDQAD